LNGYPGVQVVRYTYTGYDPVASWHGVCSTAPSKFYAVGKYLSYGKNVPGKKTNLLFTEE